MTAAPHAVAAQALAHNVARLAHAALQAMADELDAVQPPARTPSAVDEEAAAIASDLDRMDLSMLDGLDLDGPPAAQAQPAALANDVALAEALADLPADLPPLTGALSGPDFVRWLALYRSGHDGLHHVVALVQQQNRTGLPGHPPESL